MSWLIENGSYPYLNGIAMITSNMTAPYPASIWICGTGSYPSCALLPEPAQLGCFANATNLRSFRYAGTLAQWQNVQRGEQWHANAHFDKVSCADGGTDEL